MPTDAAAVVEPDRCNQTRHHIAPEIVPASSAVLTLVGTPLSPAALAGPHDLRPSASS